MLKIPEMDGNLLKFALPDRRYVALPTRLSITEACTGYGAFSVRRNENTALKWPKYYRNVVISSFPQIYEPGCERQVSLWLRGQFGTDEQCRYLTVETHTQAGTGTMFNKLKYPARGDLPVRGIEFVEGTGASYLLADRAHGLR